MTVTEIRTYKPRQGRLRPQRRQALRDLLPRYGMAVTGDPLDPAVAFGRRAPLVLEIGSGSGEVALAMATAHPERDHLAAEAHAAGVADLLRAGAAAGITNLRVANGDALVLLRERLAPGSLAEIHAYFPDPWPKQRHHKRRLFQPGNVALLRSRLAPGGTLHTATDDAGYAAVIRDTLRTDPDLVDVHGGWAPRPPYRPVSRYERRARAAGRPVFELVFGRR